MHSDSLLGRAIETNGVENFISQILAEVEENETSLWKDYYIIQYNTMYPNGYNESWNCSEKTRDLFLNGKYPIKTSSYFYRNNYTKNEMLFHLAKVIQKDDNKENRILNQEQLNTFYEARKEEIENRIKILNAYNKNCLVGVTSAAKRRAKEIEDLIQSYNLGSTTWSVQGLDELKYEEDYDDILEKGMAYFEDSYGYIPDFGMPTFIKSDLYTKRSFGEDGIVLYCNFQTDPIFNTYRTLFKAGFLNPEKIWFIDRDGNKIDIDEKYVWKEHGYLKLIITP